MVCGSHAFLIDTFFNGKNKVLKSYFVCIAFKIVQPQAQHTGSWSIHGSGMGLWWSQRSSTDACAASFDTPFTNDTANELERSMQGAGVKEEPALINTGIKDICPSPLLPLSFPSLSYFFVPVHLPHFLPALLRMIPPQHTYYGFVPCACPLHLKIDGWRDRFYLSIIPQLSSEMQINLTTCGEY